MAELLGYLSNARDRVDDSNIAAGFACYEVVLFSSDNVVVLPVREEDLTRIERMNVFARSKKLDLFWFL